MVDKTTAIYIIIDDILKAIGHYEDKRRTMTDAEVIATAIISAMFFSGNMEKARSFMSSNGIVKNMLGKSRFCRRVHAVADLIYDMFHQLGSVLKTINISSEYIVDSFPIPVCDNIRIKRCKIAKSEDFRGYIASKKRYFYGVRVHVLVTSDGIPVELAFLPGEANDVRGLDVLNMDLPPDSYVYGDSAYTDYNIEDAMKELDCVNLDPLRKKNSLRCDEPCIHDYKKLTRKYIESVFSAISYYLPKWIHAVTLKGFLLKICLFVFAYTIEKAFL